MPLLYEHVRDGEVTEQVQPAEGSRNAAQLAEKAADKATGWQVVDETPKPAPKPVLFKS